MRTRGESLTRSSRARTWNFQHAPQPGEQPQATRAGCVVCRPSAGTSAGRHETRTPSALCSRRKDDRSGSRDQEANRARAGRLLRYVRCAVLPLGQERAGMATQRSGAAMLPMPLATPTHDGSGARSLSKVVARVERAQRSRAVRDRGRARLARGLHRGLHHMHFHGILGTPDSHS